MEGRLIRADSRPAENMTVSRPLFARTEVIEEVRLLPVNDHLAPAQFDELVLGQEAEESLLSRTNRLSSSLL
jgi:hypothetical protein